MNLTEERIYQLLPAVYRQRDAELGGQLRALVSVIAEQARIAEADITALNDNWFIETCEEWVVPYLGDLLGVQGLHTFDTSAGFSQRGRVANTLAYRRRKGTATVVEQLAFDTSGWRARAVEFFQILEWNQNYNHVRLEAHRTPDLRRTDALELLDTAFDTASHTVDVRRIESGRGRHNLPNLGVFLWRIQSYAVTQGDARAATGGAPVGAFLFDPLGRDLPLFNRPQTETAITHLAEEINVPAPLRRRPLYDELEARRQALVSGTPPVFRYFDDRANSDEPPVLEIQLATETAPISADEILICHLGDWTVPADTRDYPQAQPDGSVVQVARPIRVAVDPLLGRLIFPASLAVADSPRVSYAYGAVGDVGGGPYNRFNSVEIALTRAVTWPVAVSHDLTPVAGQIFNTLGDAIDAWNLLPAGQFGVITVLDSGSYLEALTGARTVQIATGSRLLIVAADWPDVRQPGGLPGKTTLAAVEIDPDELRPHLRGNIAVRGTAAIDETPGEFAINGLLVEGSVTIADGRLGRFELTHSTLVPSAGGITVGNQNEQIHVVLNRSISGPVVFSDDAAEFSATDSIIDAASGLAVDAPRVPAAFRDCTVFGEVSVQRIEASGCIFNQQVTAVRRQEGCVRFCYVSTNSDVPRRYRCQPAMALSEAHTNAEKATIELRLTPAYIARDYGQPAYAQLHANCAEELRTGAEDGSEMGVYRFLKQPQREANLRVSLDEYLRFGLEAGFFLVT